MSHRAVPGRLLTAGLLVVSCWAPAAHAAAEVQARIARQSVSVGETAALEVVVKGAFTGVRDPEFDVPAGLEVLGSSRSQSLSSINGQSTIEVVYQYEIGANKPGSYTLGPIQVRAGGQLLECAPVSLSVAAARARVGSGGEGPASLTVDVTPAQPYVGQPVIMRVRLVQRSSLAEDPSYSPPSTAKFWAERASQPESYYADERGRRVLVTETRTRLYPLAAGDATIGDATATLVLATPESALDPLQWLGGRVPRREAQVRSLPVHVRVRVLPSGPPAGFAGAVGNLTLTWSADRARTSQDVPVSVRLDIRGLGNLPLVHTPELESQDFEMFASTVEDSLAVAGSASASLRSFQWTVLPRHQGPLELPVPDFVWFDPQLGQYRRAALPPIVLAVGPPLSPASAEQEAFPAVFSEHPCDPFRRGSQPWAFAVAGLALGVAVRLWRIGSRPPPDQVEQAERRQWLHAVGRGSGPEFWSSADRACEWLEGHGRPVDSLRNRIAASRYGGLRAEAESVRRELVTHLSEALPAAQPRGSLRLGAAALAVAGVALCLIFGSHRGVDRGAMRARVADQTARAGDVQKARALWNAVWREGGHQAGLAARLAWAELSTGSTGPASLWALRGDREEPRDPALSWVVGQIRETGGLAGFVPARLPVRRIEWAVLALVIGTAVALSWPRRWPTAAAAGLLLACALVYPLEGWVAERATRGIVRLGVRLEGTNIELEPGQVVTLLEREGRRARAAAGRGVSGWVPLSAVQTLERLQ